MKPTQDQLNDPKWWSDNVHDDFNYAFTTGPDWKGGDKWIGMVEFATKDGDQDDGQLVIGVDCWVLLAKRPTMPVFVPEVGGEYEMLYHNEWVHVFFVGLDFDARGVFRVAGDSLRSLSYEEYSFQPIKSERELCIEQAAKIMFEVENGVINDNSLGALYDAGMLHRKEVTE